MDDVGKRISHEDVGVYLSVPFCRAKCTFCNFASDAFPPEAMGRYVDRLVWEMRAARVLAEWRGFVLPSHVRSIYLGGGTPSLLEPAQMIQLFEAVREQFAVESNAEITVEAAPGQIADALLDAMLGCGVNRISLGVQTFVDREARAVGRTHTAERCLAEIERLRGAGVARLGVDLIAGLPHQNAASLTQSIDAAISSGAGHVSVYMLEVDEDSRLGIEVQRTRAESQMKVLGQTARYSAAAVPSEDLCADLYCLACERLDAAGFTQYEISNFARTGEQSQHNRRYWERLPYLGCGLDAHSMLLPEAPTESCRAVRFANGDDLGRYLAVEGTSEAEQVDAFAAFEESVFLGLRLNEGLDVATLEREHGAALVQPLLERARDLDGLLHCGDGRLALTRRGRVLSSSVFGELLAVPA